MCSVSRAVDASVCWHLTFPAVVLYQAFRLIDRDDKGYISREDVHRILCTTNVQDLEYVHDPTRTTAGKLFPLN